MLKLLIDKCFSDPKSPQAENGWFVVHGQSVVASYPTEVVAGGDAHDRNERATKLGSDAKYVVIEREGDA